MARRKTKRDERLEKIKDAARVAVVALEQATTVNAFKEPMETVVEDLRELQEEMQEKVSNIEESFPDGNPTSHQLTEDADALESALDEIEGWEPEEPDNVMDMTPDDFKTWQDEQREAALELVRALEGIGWNMTQKDVKIGGRYKAKISNQWGVVRIIEVSRFGGWVGLNEATGRTVRIQTAARLTPLPQPRAAS